MLVSTILRKDTKTLKYSFNQSYVRALSEGRITSFPKKQYSGHLVMAWRTKMLLWRGKSPNLPIRRSLFFSVFWKYVEPCQSSFKMLVLLDFLLCPFCFYVGKKCIFEERRMQFFVFCNIIYCFYKVQPMDGFSFLRCSAIHVSALSPLLSENLW